MATPDIEVHRGRADWMPGLAADPTDYGDHVRRTDALAEQSLLGCLLLDNSALHDLPQGFSRADLTDSAHRFIFRAVSELVDAGTPADVVTVYDQLQRWKQADHCGGLQYLQQLQQGVPPGGHIARYASLVQQSASARREQEARGKAADAVKAGASPAEVLELLQGIARPAVAPPKPVPLDFKTLATQRAPARVWVRDKWLTSGATVLGALGGTGKSSLVQHEMTAGALGRPYFAAECMPYRSLFWNAEDDGDELWRRQERICDHEQIDMATLAENLFLVSRFGFDNALMAESHGQLITTPLMRELREQVNDLGVEVLWLDNAAHFFAGNHNDSHQVTAFINALNGLVRGRPLSVVIVVHTARGEGSEFAGSAAWENAARMRWYLSAQKPGQRPSADDEEGTDCRFLSRRKSNYSSLDSMRFSMREGLLVPDAAPVSHVGGVMSALDDKRAEEVFLAGLKTLKGMGIDPSDKRQSPDFAPRHIVGKGLAAGFNARDLERAMNRLMGSGRLIRGVVGLYANRTPRHGLVVQEEA